MNISAWPVHERPRERLLAQGAEVLSDAELVAIFLRTGCRGRNAVELARMLIDEFGDLRGLLTADYERFCALPGLGPAKFVQLHAVLEICRRYLALRLKRARGLPDPQATKNYFQVWLRDRPRETFACLFLDNQHRPIACEAMFQGTINSATVYPREVVRRSLEHRAAALIFAHNHPSGVAEPSAADRDLTQRLKDALALVDIRVLDHLVIGDGETTSFAERGLL